MSLQARQWQKALRWILDFDAVSAVIPGARSAAQARANAVAAELPRLSDQAHARLKDLYQDEIAATVRGAY